MKATALLLTLPVLGSLTLVACVNNSNLCPTGFEYASQYDACLAVDAGAADDAAPPAATDSGSALGSDAAPSEGGQAGEGGLGTESTGLGNSCNADSDCSGAASYCLKDPTAAPTAPGFCTLTHCTAATASMCTSAYGCCDCTSSVISTLQAYPPGFCAPTADEAELTAVGCTCQ